MSKIRFKSDLEKEVPAVSEAIEYAYSHMIGVMGTRYLKAKETGDSILMLEAARDLWAILELINLQTIYLSTATHASIAIGNEMQRVASALEEDLGVNLIHDAATDRKLRVVELVRDSWLAWHDIGLAHLAKKKAT